MRMIIFVLLAGGAAYFLLRGLGRRLYRWRLRRELRRTWLALAEILGASEDRHHPENALAAARFILDLANPGPSDARRTIRRLFLEGIALVVLLRSDEASHDAIGEALARYYCATYYLDCFRIEYNRRFTEHNFINLAYVRRPDGPYRAFRQELHLFACLLHRESHGGRRATGAGAPEPPTGRTEGRI